jgi:hypothetical protein
MSDTYFAADKMNTLIAMAKDGVRDLTSDLLKPYWDTVPDLSDEELQEAYDASAAFRDASGITPIGISTFASQAAKATGHQTFIQYLNEMGIESEYTEDVTAEEQTSLPDLGELTEVVQTLKAKGYEPDPAAMQERFSGMEVPISSGTVLHLEEPLPSAWADEDDTVASRLARARTYVAQYLGEGL